METINIMKTCKTCSIQNKEAECFRLGHNSCRKCNYYKYNVPYKEIGNKIYYQVHKERLIKNNLDNYRNKNI
jgi:hypothetical protein